MSTAIPNTVIPNAAATGYEVQVETDRIDPSPYQTRQRFDDESLQTLAASLKQHGQLQNLIVRVIGDRAELIGGERRWRAAKLAGLEKMRCLVIEADDNQARELVIIENLERENVTAIEEAFGFQQLIDAGQYNQKTLAERLGRDPSFVSNRMRLLALPEEWRQRIVDGDILPTQARLLVPWADRPDLLHAIAVKLAKAVAPDSDEDDENDEEGVTAEQPATQRQVKDLSCDEVSDIINEVIHSMTRSMERSYWNGPKFEVTEEVLKQLDVVQVQSRYVGTQKVLVAFNVALWDELQDAAQAQKARKPQFDPNELDQDDSDDDVLDEDESSNGQKSRLQEWNLTQHMAKHVSAVLAGHIKSDNIGLRTFLMIMADDGGYAFMRWLGDSQGIEADDILEEEPAWNVLATITQKNFGTQMALFLQERLAKTDDGHLLNLEQMLLICRDMKLDPVAHWTPDAELLELCSDDQLREILVDHVAPEKQVKKWKRGRMLKEAADGWPAGFLPVLLKPKVMFEFEAAQAEKNR